ncbi:hypothetical protein Lalb_Chr03g0041201 [Lupinus albus]|uniref:Uncharacterized protein n=1 Tax=Lupinus albus TaxID=3870 RepID=A0A6A4QVU3_LUPAL|nr:hypothetical protein Lalb_Chr03g0041201 [Lupinus albus]
MDLFINNNDLDFEDHDSVPLTTSHFDSDFEDDLEMSKVKSDTSASEARNGKDIQGIPWERLNTSRAQSRQNRLKEYQNYQNFPHSPHNLDKECLKVQKGKNFYDFQFNTRLVKSTVVHFQVETLSIGRHSLI